VGLPNPITMPPFCATCPTRDKTSFRLLDSDQVETLCTLKRPGHIPKGEELFTEGQNVRGIYCVQNGHFKLTRHNSSGRDTIVRFASPGDIIGYRALLAQEPISISAVAIQDANACFLSADIFLNFLEENGPFALDLLRATCHELSEANHLLASLAQKSVKQRLAEVLLMLRAKFSEDTDGCIDIDLKRSEIADLVGTATESLIRLLAQFEREELISRQGKRFKITQAKKLAQLAELVD
jgi:CRP-like cAMP-binding protein